MVSCDVVWCVEWRVCTSVMWCLVWSRHQRIYRGGKLGFVGKAKQCGSSYGVQGGAEQPFSILRAIKSTLAKSTHMDLLQSWAKQYSCVHKRVRLIRLSSCPAKGHAKGLAYREILEA